MRVKSVEYNLKRDFGMRKIICSVFVFAFSLCSAYAASFTSCGPGYILAEHRDIDGIDAAECQKLWCRDLENGKSMGTAKSVASGYRDTGAPVELCDAKGNCVECFGDRKWCAGEVAGIWNPEYGAYTRGGADNATYTSYQKGSCFAWRLEKPECEDGKTAILRDGQWVCATSTGSTEASRASSIRRTGTMRRIR